MMVSSVLNPFLLFIDSL